MESPQIIFIDVLSHYVLSSFVFSAFRNSGILGTHWHFAEQLTLRTHRLKPKFYNETGLKTD